MDKSKNNESRRNFLNKSILTGAGLGALGLTGSQLNKDNNKDEVVKMITLDGKLVEVNRKHVTKMCAGRVSNATLKNWMDKEKKQQG